MPVPEDLCPNNVDVSVLFLQPPTQLILRLVDEGTVLTSAFLVVKLSLSL